MQNHFVGLGYCLALSPTLHGHYIIDVSVNYIKVVSGWLSLISNHTLFSLGMMNLQETHQRD